MSRRSGKSVGDLDDVDDDHERRNTAHAHHNDVSYRKQVAEPIVETMILC
ncbi:hypothetical protein I2750_23200 [Bacillus sp. PR5]|nr:hypothetical protein [Bacillus sp. PR5]